MTPPESIRPRVLQVALSLNPGGTERLIIDLVRRLSGTVDMAVCCLDEAGKWGEQLQQDGIRVTALQRQPGFQAGLGRQISQAATLHSATLIHAHQYTPFVYACLSRLSQRAAPVVFTEHGRLSDAPPSAKRRLANRLLRRLPARVFAVSADLKRFMAEEGFRDEQIQVLYNGIEVGPLPTPSARAEARASLAIGEKTWLVGTVARLDPVKNLATLLRAVAALKPRRDVAALIVGDGPERARLTDLTAELGIQSQVCFLGHRDDARRWLAGCDAYVNASTSEGVSLTILEAMAAGLPVVATRVGGTPEVVTADCGVLVPARDHEALATAIDSLAGSSDAARALGKAGRSRVETHFNLEQMVHRYAGVYRSVHAPLAGKVDSLFMCGIAGAFGVNGPLHPDLPSAVRRMTAAIAHRGPDGDGFFDGPRVCLAQRRLAIIDRAGGRQPMANEDESCWITFNGEIYNHRELRPKLEAKGHRYRTVSDTETILHAYEEYGPACVDHLEGMFAFVIYDGRRQELFAARDRLGKKPFFYTVLDGMFHFASELPALRQSPLWSGELDLTGLEGYLSLGYFIAPATVYRNVHKLMPGHWLRIANGRLETRQYWDVTEFDTDHRPDTELLVEIDATLRQAVHERLESEVPLGAFLSGGIDSGLVVSYMAEALGDRLVTASVGFGDPEHNELAAAEITARHFKSRHFSELIEPRLDECIGPVMDHLGEPLADSSAIPTWYVSRAARRHVTVALSGDGGDEAWAGYDFRYVPFAMEAAARRWMPGAAGPAFGWLGEKWPRGRWVPKAMRAGTLLENLGRDPAGAYYADLAFMKPADTRQLMGLAPDRTVESSPVYQAVTEPFRQCPSLDLVQRAEYADLKVYMPNDPLVKVDRMSMAHSLEVRCPLLDRRVVELAFRIPASRKQVGRQGKALLRALARRRLPEGLWQLPKRGFTVPIAEWITGPHLNMFREEVLRPTAAVAAHLDAADLERRVGIHVKRQADQSHALWAVWVLERWLRGQSA